MMMLLPDIYDPSRRHPSRRYPSRRHPSRRLILISEQMRNPIYDIRDGPRREIIEILRFGEHAEISRAEIFSNNNIVDIGKYFMDKIRGH